MCTYCIGYERSPGSLHRLPSVLLGKMIIYQFNWKKILKCYICGGMSCMGISENKLYIHMYDSYTYYILNNNNNNNNNIYIYIHNNVTCTFNEK